MKPKYFSTLTGSTLIGLVWSLGGAGFQTVLRITILMVLSRLLSPSDFGTISAALIIIGFLNMISELGIGSAIVQIEEIKTSHLETAHTFSIIFGCLLSLLLWLLSPLIATLFKIEGFSEVLRMLSIVLPIKGFGIVAENLIIRNLKFKVLTFRQVISYAFGYGVVGIILSKLGFGVWALVGANIGQTTLNMILVVLIQPHPKKFRINLISLRQLLRLGGGFTTASVGNYFATQIDNILIGRYLGATDLGLYSRSYQLMAMPAILIGQSMDKVLFPTLARLQEDVTRLRKAFIHSMTIVAVFTLPISAFSVILAPEIIKVILGSSWDGAIVPFRVLAVGMFFRTAYKISDNLTRSLGAVYPSARRQWIYALLVFLGTIIGKNWGINGVAVGVLIALVIHFLIMTNLSLTLLSLSYFELVKTIFRVLGITIIISLEILVLSSPIRLYSSSPLVQIIITVVFVLVTFLGYFLLPRSIIGEENKWLMRISVAFLKEKIHIK